MDVDPPVPPSSAAKKASSSPKQPKFTPKPPRQRKRRLVLPKSDSSDADSEAEQELIRKAIDRFSSGAPKVETKPSDDVPKSNEPASSKAHEPKKDVNRKSSSILKQASGKSGKSVVFSPSTATKVEVVDHKLVDDESGSSSNSENEYKEPWALHSYYPISLPLRPPGSGDPEVLNMEEFGNQEEYNESKINSALELGLSGPNDGEEKQIIFFQFPEKLPLDRVSVSLKGKEKVADSSSSIEGGGLKDLPNGYMGKMLVYKSGAIKLKLGDTMFDVSSGTSCGCDRSVAVMNTKSKKCCEIGRVEKQAVVTPDVDSILESISQL